MRRSGVLLPISSIPSQYGIGTFSKEAYKFIDFLEEAGQTLWQILPLGPTGYGDSPYQSFSTFAGNPYYIDLEEFIELGFITKADCDAVNFGSGNSVDYEKIFFGRFPLLRKAFENSKIAADPKFQKFITDNAYWLDDYALYMAIKDSLNGESWISWEEPIKRRDRKVLEICKKEYTEDILFYQFQQYYFSKQWTKLKAYANKKGIQIVGDIPIYVAFDGSDTWANPELFQLKPDGEPIAVAGCPPDAFSPTGQLWGNPLYNWEYHTETKFDWWMKRIAYCFELYDVVRIDHFRGFDEYYSIPYGEPTAENGEWQQGPGMAIFDTMKKVLGDKPVIAEDLGFLTDSVLELVANTGYPGMKILQFAFDTREDSDYLPHNYSRNCVVYTGTHDNDTTVNWYDTLAKADQAFALEYIGITEKDNVCKSLIRMALSSVADTAIIPMQDYLELGKEARFNTPSTLGENWKWRLDEKDITKKLAKEIHSLTKLYSRL